MLCCVMILTIVFSCWYQVLKVLYQHLLTLWFLGPMILAHYFIAQTKQLYGLSLSFRLAKIFEKKQRLFINCCLKKHIIFYFLNQITMIVSAWGIKLGNCYGWKVIGWWKWLSWTSNQSLTMNVFGLQSPLKVSGGLTAEQETALLVGQPPGTVIKAITAQVIQTPQGPRIVLQGLTGADFTPQQLALVQHQVKQQLLKGQSK